MNHSPLMEAKGGAQTGQEPGAMEEGYLLASHGMLSLLFYRTKDYQPRDGPIYNELGPPQSVTN